MADAAFGMSGALLDLFDHNWFGAGVRSQQAPSNPKHENHHDENSNRRSNGGRLVHSSSSEALYVSRADGAASVLCASEGTKTVGNRGSTNNDRAKQPQREQGNGRWRAHSNIAATTNVGGDGLGTWAGRQQMFLERSPPTITANPPINSLAAGANREPVRPFHQQISTGLQQESPSNPPNRIDEEEEQDEEHDINEAWRWRMGRKWQTEQHRILDSLKDGDEDDWSAALQLLAQAENGLDLQFGRLATIDRFQSLQSPTFSRSLSLLMEGGLSMRESSVDLSGSLEAPALHQIADAMLKAKHLLRQQQEIERQLDTKWEQHVSLQQPWVGNLVPAATMDSWGRFEFVIARAQRQVSGGQKLTKLLLRGKNGLQAQQVYSHLEREVARTAAEHGIVCPALELLCSGEMQWSRDGKASQCLVITAKRLHSLADSRLKERDDIGRVAATIAESAIPETCQVTINNSSTN